MGNDFHNNFFWKIVVKIFVVCEGPLVLWMHFLLLICQHPDNIWLYNKNILGLIVINELNVAHFDHITIGARHQPSCKYFKFKLLQFRDMYSGKFFCLVLLKEAIFGLSMPEKSYYNL